MKNEQFNWTNRPVSDEELAGVAQQAVRSIVKDLPEESLSMAWRSSLNESLLREAAQNQRRRRISWVLRPALGLGLAFSLAVLVMFRGSHQPISSAPAGTGLEAALVSTHRQSVNAWDVAGVGLSPIDAQSEDLDGGQSASSSPVSGWNEDDLDSL